MDLHVPPPEWVEISPDRWTQPFWDAAGEHRLLCARCEDCGLMRMPPGPFCPSCRSQDLDWVELSGRGTVFSWTVVHHPVMPDLAGSVPYGVALVELEGGQGVRLLGNLVGVDSDAVEAGMEVELEWADIRPGLSLPRFRPAGSQTI